MSTVAPGAAGPLLRTKLHAPSRRRGLIERPRLVERAIGAELPALTVVSAPAGFGKSTLLAEWSSHLDATRGTAWLSLDPADDDPAVFWRYVVAAVQDVEAGAGESALALLAAAQPAASAVSALLNDLAALDGDLVVVLDDYHVISSAEIHEAMAFLVDHLPANVHLVIASRADPPLPLARLRARRELVEIRAGDLRFTTDEATRYLNDSMGLALSAEDVATLESRTEGWAAALQLAALSMQDRDDVAGFIEGFAGDDRYVVDYLAEEVLDRQPDEVRSFLLQTAILDRFTGALCDAVTGTAGGKAMLERLDRANLFLVPLDGRRRWYRYHHLFSDVLRARLAEDGAPLDELHRRAAGWYESAGELPAAIGHAMAGHHIDTAARLIELCAPAMFQARQERTARSWLNALPETTFEDRPVLGILLIGARMISGDITGVTRHLDDVERWLEPRPDTAEPVVFDHDHFARLPAQAAVYRAALALIAGNPDATIEHATRALGLTQPTDHLQRGSAAALIGLARWGRGEIEAARQHYTDALTELTAAGHISDVLGCSLAVADMHLAQGQLSDAIRTYEHGLALARDHDVVRGTADMHVGLAEALLDRGERGGAAKHLEAAVQLGEQAGLPQHPHRWRVAMARLRRAEGDLTAALDLLVDAERHENTDMSPPVRPVTSLTARARLALGDLATARQWAAERDLSVDDELSYVHEHEHITLARLLIAGGEPALPLLSRLLDEAEAGQRRSSTIEILVLTCLAHHAQGDRHAATAALSQALTSARPEGYVQVFLDELPALHPLLRSIPADSPAGAHARTVLATAAPTSTPSSPPQGLVDELSSRELDVLRLLRGELSGPDIARELVVSLNTVRTHTKNIYMKLGVNNRREAVRRAAELGL